MVAAPVSPLERQQLESLRGPQATYWHRIRFELVGREAARAGARGILDLGAGAGLLGDWLATDPPRADVLVRGAVGRAARFARAPLR